MERAREHARSGEREQETGRAWEIDGTREKVHVKKLVWVGNKEQA